jgi:L-2-hydroxyglutarate oxidase
MEEFCREQGIAFDRCGKVIVATDARELPALERIYQRGQANGVQCSRITPARLHELEPHATGIDAIHVPETGIVDFRHVCRRLAELVQKSGGCVRTETQVIGLRRDSDSFVLETSTGVYRAKAVINCAGLYSDRVVAMSGERPSVRIVPFRGEYYELRPAAHHLCRNLIYPVPDPGFPFLGVHFTRMVQGGVEAGPNAVLALARHGYTRTSIQLGDLWQTARFGGFWRMAGRHWRMGLGEFHRSFSKPAFLKALRRLMPELELADLLPGGAGVRAQAVEASGALVDDFRIVQTERTVHVLNAPSPAATASLRIGQYIAALVRKR